MAPEAIRAERATFNVLAGSYAPAGATGVRRFCFDPDLGQFNPVAGRDGIPFPAYLARSAATGWYYAVSETTAQPVPGPGTGPAQTGQPGTIWALGPEPASPDPRLPGRALATGGDLPTHIAVHPSGRVRASTCAPGTRFWFTWAGANYGLANRSATRPPNRASARKRLSG